MVGTAAGRRVVVPALFLGAAGAAGAAYGLEAIPVRWREAVRGEWPLGSGCSWWVDDLAALADQLQA